MRLVQDLLLKNQRVLVRADLNVPQDEEGRVADDTRIRAILPTIGYILEQGGSAIVMSHLGRPKGKREERFSLAPCQKRLEQLLGRTVEMAPDCIGKEVEEMAGRLQPGQILLLENLRFHEAEEKPKLDPSFAGQLARLGDCYVNDAFGAAHRAHASIVEVPKLFGKKAAAGFLMQKEVGILKNLLTNPEHPFFALIGGAKLSSKLGVLSALLEKVDLLFVGGAMSYTFLKAQGVIIGNSLYEEPFLQEAKQLLSNKKLILPIDHIAAKGEEVRVFTTEQGIEEGFAGMDIGPQTVRLWTKKLPQAKTTFWNGPVGVFEDDRFGVGTGAIAETIAKSQGVRIVGGGDSAAALQKYGLTGQITYLSTGGGASLEYLEFGTLPGVAVLELDK